VSLSLYNGLAKEVERKEVGVWEGATSVELFLSCSKNNTLLALLLLGWFQCGHDCLEKTNT
jgi:hypothetical protein